MVFPKVVRAIQGEKILIRIKSWKHFCNELKGSLNELKSKNTNELVKISRSNFEKWVQGKTPNFGMFYQRKRFEILVFRRDLMRISGSTLRSLRWHNHDWRRWEWGGWEWFERGSQSRKNYKLLSKIMSSSRIYFILDDLTAISKFWIWRESPKIKNTIVPRIIRTFASRDFSKFCQKNTALKSNRNPLASIRSLALRL